MKLIECPRDAMQGLHDFIPTEKKAMYINALLRVGFDTIDFGSFVSPKAIPQMRDTAEVLKKLHLNTSKTKLLAIIANTRGAQDAIAFEEIAYLGFPFSVSETFQQRNTNSGITESLKRVEEIQQLCIKHNKELVIYISMAFGNPYGDNWSSDVVIDWVEKITRLGIKIVALSDTIGVSDPQNISYLFGSIIPEFPEIEIGAHLHTTPDTWYEKVDAAYKSGCRRFDGAVKGLGGCPMAANKLTGNMATENVLNYFTTKGIITSINTVEFDKVLKIANTIFPA